ncbi:TPA: hypothetical protein MW242_003516 [Acinetobacter baumannii]|nr:hypothetical protein [Acinetobacter baumannii]
MKKLLIGVLTVILVFICIVGIHDLLERDDKYISIFVGLITAASGIFTALLVNYFNVKSNKDRFNFEEAQKEKERIFNLRKDIYLNAADELVSIQSTIGKIIDVDFDIKESNILFNKFCFSMNRLMLIANVETTRSAKSTLDNCSKIYFEILRERKELIRIRAEIDAIWPLMESMEEKRNKVFELIQNNKISPNFNEDLNSQLWEEWKKYEDKRREFSSDHDDYVRKQGIEVNKLGRSVMQRVGDITNVVISLQLNMRRDLNNDENIEDYEKIISDNTIQPKEVVDSILNDYDEEYNRS